MHGYTGGHLREFTDEESNFAALLQRAMDLDGVDRETLHHLVTLLMKVSEFSGQGQGDLLRSIGTVFFEDEKK